LTLLLEGLSSVFLGGATTHARTINHLRDGKTELPVLYENVSVRSQRIASDGDHVVLGRPDQRHAPGGLIGFTEGGRHPPGPNFFAQIPDRSLHPIAHEALESPRLDACVFEQVTLALIFP
jgi:hypothetical protein